MKGKVICAAVVAALAVSTIAVVAFGNDDKTDVQNSAIFTETSETDSVEATEENEIDRLVPDTDTKDMIPESVVSQSNEASEDSVVAFEAFDPVNDEVSYAVEIGSQSIEYKKTTKPKYKYEVEGSDVALEYLSEFFGNDNFPVSRDFEENLQYYVHNSSFACGVSLGTEFHSPVDGKIIAVDKKWDLGNAVAVAFGQGKVFIVASLSEISVTPGDNVSAGQALGLCGTTGLADEPRFSLIIMDKK